MTTHDDATALPEWADVYEIHAARLHRLATLMVGRDDAHDLVADAVLRAVSLRRWSQISPADPPTTTADATHVGTYFLPTWLPEAGYAEAIDRTTTSDNRWDVTPIGPDTRSVMGVWPTWRPTR